MKNIAQGLPLKKYKGNKHKDGGIMVNALGNKTKDVNKAVAEVEGGEYNFRYDSTNPMNNYIIPARETVPKVNDMAKQADRFKGNNRIDYNTRTNLLNKSMKLNEMLRVQQEQQPMQMALGGGLNNNPFDKQPPKQKDSDFRRVYQSTPMNIAKIFDPTGISSYPDVAYSIDDYIKGKGSKTDIALNVLGALPIIGKAKALGTLAKGTSKTKKVLNTITKLGDLAGDIERFPLQTAKYLTNSATKPIAKMVNKSATNLLNFNDFIRNRIVPPLNPNQFSTKSATKSDMINAGTSLLNLGNFGSDINSVIPPEPPPTVISKKQFGGKLKKYGGGGFNDSGPIDDNIQNYYKNTTTRDVVSTPGNELTNVPMQPTAPLLSGSQKFDLPTKVQSVNPKVNNLDVSKEMEQASSPVKQKKNNFKGALSAVSGAVSALGPIGQGVGAAMQLAPYAIDLGKAMFDKTSVQDLQTQGSAMRLPNTTYAKNGGKLNVKPLPKFILGGDPNSVVFKNIIGNLDTVGKRALNTIVFEKDKGSITGTGLPNAGNPNLPSNVSNEEARKVLLKDYYPKVQGKFSTAMEQGDALDFVYNTGKDVRTYAYQEYLRKTDPNNKTGWKDNNDKWKDRNKLPSNFDELYNTSVGKLSEQERRDYIKQAKEYYYQNTYTDKPGVGKGIGYWDKTTNPSKDKKYYYDEKTKYYYEYGPDGTLSPGYGKTWKPRIENDKYDISANSKPLVVAPSPVQTNTQTNTQTPANVVPSSATTTPVVTNSTTQKIGDYSFDTTKLTPLTDLKTKLDKGEITEKDMVYITEDDRAVIKNPDGTYKFKETTMDEDSDIRIRNALTGSNTLTTLPTSIKSIKPGINNLKTLDVKKEMNIAKKAGLNVVPQPSESESSRLFKAGQKKQKLSEALMYGMAALPSEQIKTITPDYGRGDDAMSRMGLSTEPIRQEMMQGANKALELTRSQVGTAGQLQSRGQSIMSNLSSQLSQSQIQQQQYLNQLRGALAQREDTKANVLAQSQLTAREAKSAERAAKLDQLNNAISQTSAIGAGTMEQASKMSTIENENERFKRNQDFIRELANQGVSFEVDDKGKIVFNNKVGSSNIKQADLSNPNPLVVKDNPSTTTGNTYTVIANDTLSDIASKNNMTLDELKKLNPEVKDKILPGQTIKIK
jgi:LysM repeat protein